MLVVVQVESRPADADQPDLVAFTHVIKHSARTGFLFHKHFQIGIVRRTGKRKVRGFFAGDAKNRNLTGNELNAVPVSRAAGGMKIEGARESRLIAHFANHEL